MNSMNMTEAQLEARLKDIKEGAYARPMPDVSRLISPGWAELGGKDMRRDPAGFGVLEYAAFAPASWARTVPEPKDYNPATGQVRNLGPDELPRGLRSRWASSHGSDLPWGHANLFEAGECFVSLGWTPHSQAWTSQSSVPEWRYHEAPLLKPWRPELSPVVNVNYDFADPGSNVVYGSAGTTGLQQGETGGVLLMPVEIRNKSVSDWLFNDRALVGVLWLPVIKLLVSLKAPKQPEFVHYRIPTEREMLRGTTHIMAKMVADYEGGRNKDKNDASVPHYSALNVVRWTNKIRKGYPSALPPGLVNEGTAGDLGNPWWKFKSNIEEA